MKIHNSLFFLLDTYYSNKYVEGQKLLQNKSISFFIGNVFKKTNTNKKFKTLRPIYNAICSFYFKRNVFYLKEEEMEILLNEIDKELEIIPRCYHLEDLYEEEPMTAANFKSLKKYNFYDLLLFEYATHKDKKLIFEKMIDYNSKLRKCEFNQ
tara:strand:- start:87 stop:545 length:459 start_codon:yes stop_codon:yes gene_type:complete